MLPRLELGQKMPALRTAFVAVLRGRISVKGNGRFEPLQPPVAITITGSPNFLLD